MFGLFNALLESILWPIFPMLVSEKAIGLGFGCVSVINNVFLALVPLLNGWLHDVKSVKSVDGKTWIKDDYDLVMVSMGFFTLLGAVFCVLLYFEDGGKNGSLSKK